MVNAGKAVKAHTTHSVSQLATPSMLTKVLGLARDLVPRACPSPRRRSTSQVRVVQWDTCGQAMCVLSSTVFAMLKTCGRSTTTEPALNHVL